MPTLLVRRRAAEGDLGAESLVHALESDLSDDEALSRVVTMLRQDPALEETRALAQRTADDAVAILEELPEGPVREALIAFTRTLVERRR